MLDRNRHDPLQPGTADAKKTAKDVAIGPRWNGHSRGSGVEAPIHQGPHRCTPAPGVREELVLVGGHPFLAS
jgi:hypothetical protein